MKRTTLPLLFLIIISLGVVVVSGQTTTYEKGVAFLSDVAGGNITFAENITATQFSNAAGNQARFTGLNMLGNGSIGRLGFRNNNGNNSINITRLGVRYVQIDCTIENATTLQFWSPDLGRADYITGGGISWFAGGTLNVNIIADDTIILEWRDETFGDRTSGVLSNTSAALGLFAVTVAGMFVISLLLVGGVDDPELVIQVLVMIAIAAAVMYVFFRAVT